MDCLSPLHLVLLASLSGSFVWNIFLCHLILSELLFIFYVYGSLVTFLNLGEVALCRRRPLIPSRTLPLSLPKLYALGVPPKRAACILLLGGYVGGLLSLAPSLVRCHPALYGCCWLVGPGPEAAGRGTLVGLGLVLAHWWAVRAQKPPGLRPGPWWVTPGPGLSAGVPVGRAGSWSLVTGLGDPSAVAGLLPGPGETQFLGLVTGDSLETGYCHGWVGSACLKACAALLVGSVRDRLIPGEGLVSLLGELNPLQDCGFLWCGICPLVRKAGLEARASRPRNQS